MASAPASQSSTQSSPVVSLHGVSFAFPGGRRILDHCSLDLNAGSLTVLTGPSGAGKSTLFRLLARFEEPLDGHISFQGRPVAEYDPPTLRRALRHVGQEPVMIPGSVAENLRLPFTFAGNADAEVPSDAVLAEALERFDLGDVALDDTAQQCSVGQRQRIHLLRALLLRPAVLLLDEPTSALDEANRHRVEAAVEEAASEHGVCVLMISHHEDELHMDHTVLRLAEGCLVEVS